jgi:hypothetical protein
MTKLVCESDVDDHGLPICVMKYCHETDYATVCDLDHPASS